MYFNNNKSDESLSFLPVSVSLIIFHFYVLNSYFFLCFKNTFRPMYCSILSHETSDFKYIFVCRQFRNLATCSLRKLQDDDKNSPCAWAVHKVPFTLLRNIRQFKTGLETAKEKGWKSISRGTTKHRIKARPPQLFNNFGIRTLKSCVLSSWFHTITSGMEIVSHQPDFFKPTLSTSVNYLCLQSLPLNKYSEPYIHDQHCPIGQSIDF